MVLLTDKQIEAGIKATIRHLDYDLSKDLEFEAEEGDFSYESLVDVFKKGTGS